MVKQLITLKVNGEPYEVAVEPHWTLLETVRDELRLTGSYTYVRPPDKLIDREFDVPDSAEKRYVSLKQVTMVIDKQRCLVLLKRASRNSLKFRLLLTNFGALIKGDT